MPDGSVVFFGQTDQFVDSGNINIIAANYTTYIDKSVVAMFVKFNNQWYSLGARDLMFVNQNIINILKTLKMGAFGYYSDASLSIPSGELEHQLADGTSYYHVTVEPDSGKTTGTKVKILLDGAAATIDQIGVIRTFFYESGPSEVYLQVVGMEKKCAELSVGESCQFIKTSSLAGYWSPITSHPSGTY